MPNRAIERTHKSLNTIHETQIAPLLSTVQGLGYSTARFFLPTHHSSFRLTRWVARIVRYVRVHFLAQA